MSGLQRTSVNPTAKHALPSLDSRVTDQEESQPWDSDSPWQYYVQQIRRAEDTSYPYTENGFPLEALEVEVVYSFRALRAELRQLLTTANNLQASRVRLTLDGEGHLSGISTRLRADAEGEGEDPNGLWQKFRAVKEKVSENASFLSAFQERAANALTTTRNAESGPESATPATTLITNSPLNKLREFQALIQSLPSETQLGEALRRPKASGPAE